MTGVQTCALPISVRSGPTNYEDSTPEWASDTFAYRSPNKNPFLRFAYPRVKNRELVLLQNSSLFFHGVHFVKCWWIFLGLNSKWLYISLKKELETSCLGFTSSTKHEIGYFHIVVVQRRQRMYKKRCRLRRCCLSFPLWSVRRLKNKKESRRETLSAHTR